MIVQIPLEEEYEQFIREFPPVARIADDIHICYRVQAPNGLSVVVVLQEIMGRSAAATACDFALSIFDCRLYVCLGIAGSLSKDAKLGDVCYTGSVIDVYDNSKVTDVKGGGVDIAFASTSYSTCRKITASANFIRTVVELKPIYLKWQDDRAADIDALMLGPVPGYEGAEETISKPKSVSGDLVCGAVVQSSNYKNKLKGITRQILAVETESGPIFAKCRDHDIDIITIRGISDYADAAKTELELKSDHRVRSIAARNAVTFLKVELENTEFVGAFRSEITDPPVAPQLPLGLPQIPLPRVLDAIGNIIDAKLRELSPQYKAKRQGYRLPTPRIREADSGAIEAGSSRSRPGAVELEDAISARPHILLRVERTYPDPAIAWIVAAGLLLSEIGERKLVPVVISGKDIGPPDSGLASASPVPIDASLDERGGRYVFIIDEPKITSKTRVKFLLDEVRKWPDAKFIFITRAEKSVIFESDFARQVAGGEYDLCDVSFSEMANFIESNFDLPASEAEVVALKLRTTFKQFSLPAHPSFFAGIPPETLAALLNANRRSELIQLAVDGFLSFIVAADVEPVRMSRTNRSQFLRRLVCEMEIDKRSFTQAQLVDLAQKISDEFDYGLNSLAFVQDFQKQGIIHFESGLVKITLPFIRAYLLADELAKSVDKARAYFDLDDDNFDILTLDIYSEIGPSVEIVRHICEQLHLVTAEIKPSCADNILLSNKLYPAILKNPARISSLRQRVSTAKDALAAGTSDRAEKIAILNVADRINEDVGNSTLSKAEDEGEEKSVMEEAGAKLSRVWVIGSVLIGSGAEGIKGDQRQELASQLLAAGECLLHSWTKYIDDFDFEVVKRGILQDADFRASLGEITHSDYESLVSAMVDFMQFVALSMPLERTLNQLLDQAHHRIIGNSVAKSAAPTPMRALMKGLWLLNIDPALGESVLKGAVAGLPEGAVFLRAILTQLLIFRAKWKLGEKRRRYALLDAAENIIKPINPHLDKGELRRFVDKNPNLAADTARDET